MSVPSTGARITVWSSFALRELERRARLRERGLRERESMPCGRWTDLQLRRATGSPRR